MNGRSSKLLIIVGSKNDVPHLSEAIKILRILKIKPIVSVVSCHRNLPELVKVLDQDKLVKENIKVIIAVARSVSNLPAIIAGYLKKTSISVIGVGLSDKNLNGIDSLLSVNTIPKGVALLNTGINEVGIYNAVIASAKIISMLDKGVAKRLEIYINKNDKKAEYDLKV